jgi:hypothetical protein
MAAASAGEMGWLSMSTQRGERREGMGRSGETRAGNGWARARRAAWHSIAVRERFAGTSVVVTDVGMASDILDGATIRVVVARI